MLTPPYFIPHSKRNLEYIIPNHFFQIVNSTSKCDKKMDWKHSLFVHIHTVVCMDMLATSHRKTAMMGSQEGNFVGAQTVIPKIQGEGVVTMALDILLSL